MNTRTRTALWAAITFAFAANAHAQTPAFTINTYRIEGATLLPEATIQELVKQYTGSGRTIDDINAAADAVRKAYEAEGYPIVRVFPPPQETGQGSILLRIIEGQIESVSIKGNTAYNEENIRNSLPELKEGSRPNTRRIVASIAAANENPGKQVAVNFQSAEKVGNVNAVVRVTEDRPEKFTFGLDNTGNDASGKRRMNLGYQNANLFNSDHMLTVQVGTSDQPSRGFQISGGYRIPFYGTGFSLDAIASYSDSNTTSTAAFGSTQFNGRGSLYGLRLNQALASEGEYRHRLSYGLDYKDFDNTCTGANAGTCGTVTSRPVSVTYIGSLNTPDYQLGFNAAYLMNMPGGQHGSEEEFALARFNADRNWQALRGSVNFTKPLEGDWQVRTNLIAQLSNDRLIPAEQFGAGGAFTVRGYKERSITGDRGHVVNVELYTPKFGADIDTQLSVRALVFADYGVVGFTNSANALETGRSISSIGAGLRGTWGKDISVRFDVGRAMDEFAGVQGANNGRSVGDLFGHFGLNVQF